MRKIKNALRKFMYGRNGSDSLNRFILFLYILFFVAYLITYNFVVLIFQNIFFLILVFRFFSRNLPARQKENFRYLHFFDGIKKFFVRQIHKIKNRKTHVYKKCPKCKKILKLKKIKGKHSVKCPICGEVFDVKV